MPRYALAIVLGTALAFYGNGLPDRLWSAYVPILLLYCFYAPGYRLLLLAMAAWLWASALLHSHLDFRLDAGFDNRIVVIEGDIDSLPEVHQGRVSLYLNDVQITGYPGKLPRRIRLNWYQDQLIPRAADRWQFEVRLKQPRGQLNPAGFDFEAWLFTHGIDAIGYIRASPMNLRLESASILAPGYWRQRLSEKIDQHCSSCLHPGLIKALVLGFRGEMRHGERELLRDSGTAHLIAISGLHVGMVAFLFYRLGRSGWCFWMRPGGFSRNQLASCFALLAALAYAALAGFSMPTLRALIMLCVVLVAVISRNRVNLLNSISLACMLILLFDPRAIGSVSFWLSFSALLVIAFFQFRNPRKHSWWQELLMLQVCFSLLIAPLGVVIFNQFNPASLFANLAAIPLISLLVLPLVLLASLLSVSNSGLTEILLQMADSLLEWLMRYLSLLLDSGMHAIPVNYPWLVMILLVMGLLSWLVPNQSAVRGVAVVALLGLTGWPPPVLEHGEYQATIFDVGMGSSLWLRTRHHDLVYDLGPGKPGAYTAAEQVLFPSLLAAGVVAPDLLVVSHVDQDHSAGLPAFLLRYPRTRLVSGTPLELRLRYHLNQPVQSCHELPGWRWDGVDFRFLDPGPARFVASSNNRSCILLVQGHHQMLLPGDIESAVEQQLVDRYGSALESEILLAPHHGSETSSSPLFVRQVRPKLVVFTVARKNRWNFPRQVVVERYATTQTAIYRSDLDGSVNLISGVGGLEIKARRDSLRRIWRRW